MTTQMQIEMSEQSEVLERLVRRFHDDVDTVRRAIKTRPEAIVLLGRGSSDNVATVGRYALELATGRPVALGAPSLVTRYDARLDYRGVLVIGISQSGGTPEITDTLSRMREAGASTIAVTNEPTSPLATASQLVLPLLTGPERAVPATKTVTAELLRIVTIATALGDIGVGPAELAALAPAVVEVLADPQPVAALAQRWREATTLLVCARGVLLGAAQETALKIRETAAVTAFGMSSADLLHGPIAAIRPGSPALLVDGDASTGTDVAEVRRRLASLGTDTASIGTAVDDTIAVPDGLHPILAPVVATIRGQQLALHLSLVRGIDPDSPAGLSKVTVTR